MKNTRIWCVDRNDFLSQRGLPLPKATSTGTTIVGCLFKDGIVLGADTRATEGPIVADKNCEKVRLLHTLLLLPHIFTIRDIDPLHLRLYTLLWSRNSSRYWIHNSTDRFQHGNACSLNWSETSSGHRHDYAQTNVISVRISSVPSNTRYFPFI